jgi:pyruvate dehydrogenase E1 component
MADVAIPVLAKDAKITDNHPVRAIKQYKIDPEKADPVGIWLT